MRASWVHRSRTEVSWVLSHAFERGRESLFRSERTASHRTFFPGPDLLFAEAKKALAVVATSHSSPVEKGSPAALRFGACRIAGVPSSGFPVGLGVWGGGTCPLDDMWDNKKFFGS